jgi:GTP cyclohydrolase II
MLYATHKVRHAILGPAECQLFYDGVTTATALIFGRIRSDETVLVRVQSECLYGATLLFADCDCRAQMDDSFRTIRDNRSGIFIYLNHAGEGNGLRAKARAYELQEQEDGDTVAAYESFNIHRDAAGYDVVGEVLRYLQIARVRLMTNSPEKVEAINLLGFQTQRVPMRSFATDTNFEYLRSKQVQFGHQIALPKVHDSSDPNIVGPVVVVGSAVTDHVLHVETNPRLGRSRQASKYDRRAGGKGFNQAVALARLGTSVSLLTPRGGDFDATMIASTVVGEGVRAWFVDTEVRASPQTVVLEPRSAPPTYIGWLAQEHQSLPSQEIANWAVELRAARAVLFTLEMSAETIGTVLTMLPNSTLAILTASPSLETHRIPTELLERLDVVIGSANEIDALMGTKPGSSAGPFESHRRIAELCGLTVVVTDLKNPIRRVIGVAHGSAPEVRVASPEVRLPRVRLSPAVGNGDVFSAAFALETLRRTQNGGEQTGWPGRDGFYARDSNLLDILYQAVIPEAWVVKSGGGGFANFPTLHDLEHWKHSPPVIEPSRETGHA